MLEKEYPYVVADVRYEKVRINRVVVSQDARLLVSFFDRADNMRLKLSPQVETARGHCPGSGNADQGMHCYHFYSKQWY